MKAVGYYVVVKQIRGQERESSSGLLKSPEILDRFIQGEVISSSDAGSREFGIKDGDRVLFDKKSGHQVPSPDGSIYKVVTCNDIAVVL